MRPNDYFKKIFCINLDRRPDRWTRCVELFEKFDIEVVRVPAIDGNSIEVPAGCKLSKGEIGCVNSHRHILQMMVSDNLDNALILEDDIEFDERWITNLDIAMGNMPVWDMLYLGCNHVTKPIAFQANVVKVTRGFTTSSYAITRNFAQMMIPELEKLTNQVDVSYASKHRTHKCFAIKPSICWQRADHSDIQGGYTDYKQYF